jgi:hypothetical protein
MLESFLILVQRLGGTIKLWVAYRLVIACFDYLEVDIQTRETTGGRLCSFIFFQSKLEFIRLKLLVLF